MKVSIITVCKNAEHALPRTLESVRQQTYADIEHVIVDGMSTDGTAALLTKHTGPVICETDQGIYDAMNKGIRASSGELVYFLNADDVLLHDRVIEQVVAAFPPSADLLFTKINRIDPETGRGYMDNPVQVDKQSLFVGMVCHQAILARRSVFERFGYFDLEYAASADYEWLLRVLFKHRLPTVKVDIPIGVFFTGGFSNSERGLRLMNEERRKIRQKHYAFWERALYSRAWSATRLGRYLARRYLGGELKNLRDA